MDDRMDVKLVRWGCVRVRVCVVKKVLGIMILLLLLLQEVVFILLHLNFD
jgi:hypothetical protein